MKKHFDLVKDFFIGSSLISVILYLGMFGILPKSIYYAPYFKLVWVFFYLVNGPFLIYYLLVKDNSFEQKIKYYRDIVSEFIYKRINKTAASIFKFIYSIGEAIVIVIFIQRFFLGHFRVPTGSMLTTIQPGDHYVVDMMSTKFVDPARDGIFVFDSVVNKYSSQDRWCKRVVGMPGDHLEMKDEKLYVNGEALDRRYTSGPMIKSWIVPKRGDELSLINAMFEYKNDVIDLNEVRSMKNIDFSNLSVLYRGDFILNGEETGPVLDEEIYKKLVFKESIKLEEDFYFFLGDNTDASSDSRFTGFVNRSRIEGQLLFRIWPLNRLGFVE